MPHSFVPLPASRPRRVPATSGPLLLALALACSTRGVATAQEYYVEPYDYFHLGSAALRLGGYVFTDDEAGDIYGALPLLGADFRYHFFSLPLAAQTSFDFAGGDGDPDISGPGVIESDSEIFLFNWRLSLLLEPPPGTFGTRDGSFYVTPYGGGGIGLHYVDEFVEVDTLTFSSEEDETNTDIGFHLVAGIDFVFAWHFSVGVEVFYATSDVDGVIDAIDTDGFGVTATIKANF